MKTDVLFCFLNNYSSSHDSKYIFKQELTSAQLALQINEGKLRNALNKRLRLLISRLIKQIERLHKLMLTDDCTSQPCKNGNFFKDNFSTALFF